MIRNILHGLFILTTPFLFLSSCKTTEKSKALAANTIDKIITVQEVERIERKLADDSMQGRKTFTPAIDLAADFIAAEFKAIGLETFPGADNYLQKFAMIKAKQLSVSGSFDSLPLGEKDVVVITGDLELTVNQNSGYDKVYIKAGSNFFTEARKIIGTNKNSLVLVDKSFERSFGNLNRLKNSQFKNESNVIFVLTDKDPAVYSIEASHEIAEQNLMNVVGVIPGKSKKNEYVIFSGHYDHLGLANKPVNGDSIYNGANDDAAGTTAVIMLAKYFKALGNNERTIIFAAFTAEEVGGFGSQYFSRQLNADKVAAMFNIEMIGTESKWGKNSAYITGYDKTSMGEILANNLKGTEFTFHPDPYTDQQLFYRSDNATLARLGVPAHTISTSKMDSEPNYHAITDEVGTLDLENMTMIIKAIAKSAGSIIAGKDSPSRVKVNELR